MTTPRHKMHLRDEVDMARTPDNATVRAAADRLRDLLTMLGVDPDERPGHSGPTTAEVLARAALGATPAPPGPAAELTEEAGFSRLLAAASDLDGGTDADRKLAENIRCAVAEVACEDTAPRLTPPAAHDVEITNLPRGWSSAYCHTCKDSSGELSDAGAEDWADHHSADNLIPTRPAPAEDGDTDA